MLDLDVQYWTSRGFAVLDVNYGGSTGYGRAYRERLNGSGASSTSTTASTAPRYLAEQGAVDAERLAIRGGSAGGYTTLCALTFRDDFNAGASHYGVGDLEALATRHPQVRVALPRRPDRPVPRARATSTSSARRSTTSTAVAAR